MDSDPKIVELIGEMRKKGQLPALDQNVVALCNLADKKEQTQTAELTAIILRDAALTSAVLALANSAAYRTRAPIKTVSFAVILLGFEKVQSLALGLSIFKKSRENARSRELYRLFVCSYFTGTVAMSLARQSRYPNPEEVFVGGLLHQLPRLLLANSFPEKYQEMERLMMKERLDVNKACEKVFGVRYALVTHEILDCWNLPDSMKKTIREVDGAVSDLSSMIHLAGDISDMLFGNKPSGMEPMSEADKRIKGMLKLDSISLGRFLEFTFEADDNLSRFFNLTRQDIEMMTKIAEWGKVSSAEVAASLTMGFQGTDTVQEKIDPRVMIGQFFSELMIGVQKRVGVNDILMIAQEALYRCLSPECVFTAFYDKTHRFIIGRLYAGHNAMVQASDFKFSMSDEECMAVKCMTSGEAIITSAKTDHILPRQEFLQMLKLDHILLAPIVYDRHSIGIYMVGRVGGKPFSSEEKSWIEVIAGHVGLAFEQQGKAMEFQ
jgi:HD-like signal output (HDOD) protein